MSLDRAADAARGLTSVAAPLALLGLYLAPLLEVVRHSGPAALSLPDLILLVPGFVLSALALLRLRWVLLAAALAPRRGLQILTWRYRVMLVAIPPAASVGAAAPTGHLSGVAVATLVIASVALLFPLRRPDPGAAA